MVLCSSVWLVAWLVCSSAGGASSFSSGSSSVTRTGHRSPFVENRAPMLDRLLTPAGKPTVGHAEQNLLRECKRLSPGLDMAFADMNHALQYDDVEAAVRACERFQSLGVLYGDAARGVRV